MRMLDIVEKKRDGHELTTEEIRFFIDEYTHDNIPDYQASALAMAIFFQGMTDRECADITMAMACSGDRIDLSAIAGVKVDKHSTGGVGDTTTLVLAPLVAALGIPVAKMSGRGLGHTGGTIDKLEAIAGFCTELGQQQFIELVNRDKIAIAGQSGNLTPADKKLYALRDVTATVNSLPLIAASVMSKKIAAGADAIVLDVKTGAGAFMKTEEEARHLARVMVNIGNSVGRRTVAVISDMSQPLGYAIGNALEIKEAIETLRGKGPNDLTELVMELGSHMVVLAGKVESIEEARAQLSQAIADGTALAKFRSFIANQGGDTDMIDHPEKLPQASYQIAVSAQQAGIVSCIVADEIGVAAMQLGAGRLTKEDSIDLAVGIVLHKKVGDRVNQGESLATIHANRANVDGIIEKLQSNIIVSDAVQVPKPKLIYGVIS